jgi:hypothetical protein
MRVGTISSVLVAVLALGGFVTSIASASPLTSESAGATFITGDQDGGTNTFGNNFFTAQCVTKRLSAQTEGASINELTVSTSTSGCTWFGSWGVHTVWNGCAYTFTTPTRLEVGSVTWSASSQLHLACPTGKNLEYVLTAAGVSLCTVSVPPQTPTSGHVIARNAGASSPMEFTLEITVQGMHYTGTGSSCGDGATHSDAFLLGSSRVRCYANEAHTLQVGCTVS